MRLLAIIVAVWCLLACVVAFPLARFMGANDREAAKKRRAA